MPTCRRTRLAPPTSVLTRAAEQCARRVLPVPLLNHSYRTYVFGRALGELEGTDVDTELLFAGALLHDTGLVNPTGDGRLHPHLLPAGPRGRRRGRALDRRHRHAADRHHHALHPRCHRDAGPVAYLLAPAPPSTSSGCARWELPPATLAEAVREHPRAGFKDVFTEAFRQEAARVPEGRAQLLLRYGAFAAAIRFAPFAE